MPGTHIEYNDTEEEETLSVKVSKNIAEDPKSLDASGNIAEDEEDPAEDCEEEEGAA